MQVPFSPRLREVARAVTSLGDVLTAGLFPADSRVAL